MKKNLTRAHDELQRNNQHAPISRILFFRDAPCAILVENLEFISFSPLHNSTFISGKDHLTIYALEPHNDAATLMAL